jgi:hypothetical protein
MSNEALGQMFFIHKSIPVVRGAKYGNRFFSECFGLPFQYNSTKTPRTFIRPSSMLYIHNNWYCRYEYPSKYVTKSGKSLSPNF